MTMLCTDFVALDDLDCLITALAGH